MNPNPKNSFDSMKRTRDFREKIFAEFLEQNKNYIWNQATLNDVRNAVIILSSSRSGSSLLFAILRKISDFYSLSGESVPFCKLNELHSKDFPSDKISPEGIEKENYSFKLSRDFLSDFSIENDHNAVLHDEAIFHEYLNDLLLRFPLQWPQIPFSYERLKQTIITAFIMYKKSHTIFSEDEFYLELLSLLRGDFKEMNPYYYDISPQKIKKKFPKMKIPSSPPCKRMSIEEPPFILLSPRKKVSKRDLEERFLLLKSPADCYRMPFLESLLPNAHIKLIYLTRNPAASINGLMDGWLHRGFFSHNLKPFLTHNRLKPLNISGYSDKFTWGKWWWKYDLPPEWPDYSQSPLEEVCAFQWQSAHKYIQEYLSERKKHFILISYEDLIKNKTSRTTVIEKILNFIGIDSRALQNMELNNLSPIQITHKPEAFRWQKREKILLPLLKNMEINRLCSSLGYNLNRREAWI